MTFDQLQSRLAIYFDRRSADRSMRSLGPPVKLAGGWASGLYTFPLRRAELGDALATTVVLKMYAPNARGREHATREWRALTYLRGVGYSVPHLILFEPDARHLGHPFIVMDYVPGTSFWHAFEAGDPVLQAQLTRSFVAQLVALHALDPHLLEPAAVLTHPYSYVEHELEQLRHDGANSPHVTVVGVVEWLEQRKQAVPCERPAVLHRDYHPWNVLVDAAAQLWVVDWDWRIGDARFDLAWTRMLMQRSGFHAFSSDIRDEYARQSDRSLDALLYFEVLATVRWLLNVLPSTESDEMLDAAARADFRAFLVEPVRQAQTFLQDRTGIDVDVRV
jgi:aminoglycoside phosphotransferase (APT) family kinase protein